MKQINKEAEFKERMAARKEWELRFHNHILNMKERFGLMPRIHVGGDHSGMRHLNWVIAAFVESYSKEDHNQFIADENPLVRILAQRLFEGKIPFIQQPWVNKDKDFECIWMENEHPAYKQYLKAGPTKQQYLCLFCATDSDEISKIKAIGAYAHKNQLKFSANFPRSVLVSFEIDDWDFEKWDSDSLSALQYFDEDAITYERRNLVVGFSPVVVGFVAAKDLYKLRQRIPCDLVIKDFETLENGHI